MQIEVSNQDNHLDSEMILAQLLASVDHVDEVKINFTAIESSVVVASNHAPSSLRMRGLLKCLILGGAGHPKGLGNKSVCCSFPCLASLKIKKAAGSCRRFKIGQGK